jgi:hypothetical protein
MTKMFSWTNDAAIPRSATCPMLLPVRLIGQVKALSLLMGKSPAAKLSAI